MIDRLLRRGPLATVYLARAKGSASEWYTVRTVHPDKVTWSERSAEVFRREMDRVREIFHPAIPRLVAFDSAAPSPVVLTAHATGPSLRELIDAGTRPPLDEVARTVSEVAGALASLHVATPSIIHRAVCPEDIIAARHGSGVWLEGCGLAHALTAAGMIADRPTVMAEPGYLVPEELYPPTVRVDIFSLAVVAFEYLTGQRPFDRAGPSALALAVHDGAFPRPESLRAHLPGDAHAVFTRAWSLAPDGGYHSPLAFARDLAEALGVRPSREATGQQSSKPPASDDLDRAFDAMLQQAPSPPTPTIADLARLVAPPSSPLPPKPEASVAPVAPVAEAHATRSDAEGEPKHTSAVSPKDAEGVSTDRPSGVDPPVEPKPEPPSPRKQFSRPMSATRGNTPPPLPPRWPTLRTAGGLFRPNAPRPAGRTPDAHGLRRISAELGAVEAPPGDSQATEPERTGGSVDELTPIVGYERVTLATDPGASRTGESTGEIRVDELVPLEGSALHRVAELRTGDPVPDRSRTSEPSIDPGPPIADLPPPIDGSGDSEEPPPLVFSEKPAEAPFVHSLDDLPQRSRATVPPRAVPSSVPTPAPLPAPPPVPSNISAPAPAPVLSQAPLAAVSNRILKAAWVLGGCTIAAAVIAASALVVAVHDLNAANGEVERATVDQPDAAATRVPPDVRPDAGFAAVGPIDAGATDVAVVNAVDASAPSDAGAVIVRDVPIEHSPTPVVVDAGRRIIAGVNPSADAGVRPTDRERAILMAQLRPRVTDCVEGIEQPWVNIGVRYDGTTGQATAVHLHGIFLDPPIGPCLESAIRGIRSAPVAAPYWDTNLSFAIEPPRWHQTEHRQ